MLVVTKAKHYEAGRVREIGDIYEVSDTRAAQLGAFVEPYGGHEDVPPTVMPPDGPPADKAMKRGRKVKVR